MHFYLFIRLIRAEKALPRLRSLTLQGAWNSNVKDPTDLAVDLMVIKADKAGGWMDRKKRKPYGSWDSPITSALIASGTVGLGQTVLDVGDIYWNEMRPAEDGRNVIVRWTRDGRISDMTAPSFNARTRVHEYGGGAFAALDGLICFVNFADQRIYCQELSPTTSDHS